MQARNEEAILDAALTVFSAYGYRGATVDQIAAEAGMSKPNLLYYFRRKEDIYITLLERTLEDWLEPLKALDPDGDPAQELTRYITTKLEMSRDNPAASRLFANEILHGAPMIGDFLKGPLRRLVDEKGAVIRQWSELGKITAIDPYHLIFAIWATTQHYADFDVQVRAVTGKKDVIPAARDTLLALMMHGLQPR
ncbi:MAG: TetR family transcriptional regulator C-terminal domain-containing protein [Aestuariivirga sp.]